LEKTRTLSEEKSMKNTYEKGKSYKRVIGIV